MGSSNYRFAFIYRKFKTCTYVMTGQVRRYIDNIPECFFKNKKNPEIKSLLWLNKIGRLDLITYIELNRNYSGTINFTEYYSFRKKSSNNSNLEKKLLKSQITLGIYKENRMLTYPTLNPNNNMLVNEAIKSHYFCNNENNNRNYADNAKFRQIRNYESNHVWEFIISSLLILITAFVLQVNI